RRIEARVERMFAEGIVDEARKLLESGVSEQTVPFKSLGYRQVLKYLKGMISLEEAIYLTKQETRHYAKRQITWFRKSPGITWFDSEDFEGIREYLVTKIKG
ncbi:MAG: tRNA (adenosine(37)-N6)-dimethylallyltransferase MiaA, partial [Candidatus Saccharicenans sp.]